MMAFLAVCVVCATVLVGGREVLRVWLMDQREERANARAERLAEIEARNADRELVARQVKLNEQAAEQPKAEPTPYHDAPIPSDLQSRIDSWEDDFARDMERDGIYALYRQLGSWDAVRLKLPVLIAEGG